MELKTKDYNFNIKQEEINEVEGELFTLLSNFKNKAGSDSMDIAKEEAPNVYNLWKRFGRYKTM